MIKTSQIDSQLRQNDCGISAIKTVCNLLDVEISRESIEAVVKLDEAGASLGSIQQFFHKYGFGTQYRLLDVNALNGHAQEIREWLPCITPIQREGGLHYVVLEDIRDDRFSVLDPNGGRRLRWSVQEFKKNAFFSPSLLDYADLGEILRVRVGEELDRWNIRLPQAPTPKKLPDFFNKIQYFNHIHTHFGFANENAARAFLEDLLLNQEMRAVPEHFQALRDIGNEKIQMRAPILLSIKKTGEINTPENIFKNSSNLYWRLFQSIRGVRDLWGIFLMTTITASFIGYFSVFINQTLVDQVLPSYDLTMLQIFTVGVGVFALVEMFFYAYKKTLSIYLGNALDRFFLGAFDEKLNQFSVQYIQSYKRGDLTERLGDAVKLKSFFLSFFSSIFINALTATVSLTVLFFINYALAFVIVGVLGIFLAMFWFFTPLIVRLEQQRFSAKASFFSKFIEKIDGIQVIRSLGIEGQTSGEIRQKINEMVNVQTRARFVSLANTLVTMFVTSTASLTFLMITSRQLILTNSITLGMIITFLSLSGRIFSAFQTLLEENLSLQEFNVTLRRFFDFDEHRIITPKNEDPNAAADNAQSKKRALEPQYLIRNFRFERLAVQGVSFAYVDDRWVLKDLNFNLQRGERVWIQGENGAGKSTFCKIISLLYPATVGQILVNDLNQHFYEARELRRRVALISGDDLIFNDTLIYNITFGRPVDMNKLVEYASVIQFMDYINSQPDGFNHLLHEKGRNLSTGQRKKLLLLRALMTESDVLILDEIFNGMDEISKANAEFLLDFLKERTIIIISHMAVDRMRFDRRYLLKKGQLILKGNN